MLDMHLEVIHSLAMALEGVVSRHGEMKALYTVAD